MVEVVPLAQQGMSAGRLGPLSITRARALEWQQQPVAGPPKIEQSALLTQQLV